MKTKTDRRKGERRSFMWEEPYNFTGVSPGIKFKRPERRGTIIKTGRRNGKERRLLNIGKAQNYCSFWRKAWLNKPEVPGMK